MKSKNHFYFFDTIFNRNILYCKYKLINISSDEFSYLIETFCIVNYKDCNGGIDWYDNLIETFCIVNLYSRNLRLNL